MKVISGSLILLGTIIGAGIFTLPFFSYRLGLLFFPTLILAILINYALSFIYLNLFIKTNSSRLEEIPRKLNSEILFYFSAFMKYLALLSASLIYVIGISDIIYNLLKTFGFTINIELLKLAIIVSLFFVLKTNLKFYEKIERGLVVGLIALVFGIIILLFLMKPDLSNFYSILSNTSVPIFYFAISLGPFLFASMDTTTTPQVYKLLNYDYRKTTYSITLAYVVT